MYFFNSSYSDKNGTEKFDVVLGDVQTNEKFHNNQFSVTKMLLKGYKLEGDKHSLTLCNKTRSIVFDIIVHMQNGALYCARFTRTLGKSETANPVRQGEEDSLKVAKKILKVNIKWAHDCLGHLSKDVTCKIAVPVKNYCLVWAEPKTIATSAILYLTKLVSYHFTVKPPCFYDTNRKPLKRAF